MRQASVAASDPGRKGVLKRHWDEQGLAEHWSLTATSSSSCETAFSFATPRGTHPGDHGGVHSHGAGHGVMLLDQDQRCKNSQQQP